MWGVNLNESKHPKYRTAKAKAILEVVRTEPTSPESGMDSGGETKFPGTDLRM